MWRLLAWLALPKRAFRLAPHVPLSLAYLNLLMQQLYASHIAEHLNQASPLLRLADDHDTHLRAHADFLRRA